MNLFLASTLLLLILGLCLYVFVRVNPATLASAIRAFTTTFAILAGTGLLLAGRIGLAMITISAAIMALRAFRTSGAPRKRWTGSGPSSFGQSEPGKTSEVVTEMLAMTLDHQTGDLDGEVLKGSFAGRTLVSLGLQDLLRLLLECRRDDPQSVPLLETYLDRQQPDWRLHADEDQTSDDAYGRHPTSHETMDRATACSILNVSPTAGVDEIKNAHRQLMNKLHPDHGGSSYLAAQLNQAKDVLLKR